jgi:hypothetical protein
MGGLISAVQEQQSRQRRVTPLQQMKTLMSDYDVA